MRLRARGKKRIGVNAFVTSGYVGLIAAHEIRIFFPSAWGRRFYSTI